MPVAGLHEAIRQMSDPTALLDRIVRHSLTLIPDADGASLEMRRGPDTLEYVSAAGSLARLVGVTLPVGKSLSGLALRSGQVQLCDDARIDPRVDVDAVRRTGVVSMLCVPLSDQLGGIAVLKVSARRPHAFTAKDVATLERLAAFLDVSLRAASDLEAATAAVLEAAIGEGADGPESSRAETERFVADVLTPGLAERTEAALLIDDVIGAERLHVVAQPIVDLRTRSLVAVEALTRFPSLPPHSPDHWFALAHVVGRGEELEGLAITKALAAVPSLPVDVRVAVNVSPETVLAEDFRALVEAAPLERLTIELTEHSAVADYGALVEVLRPLRDSGARLSVDDTGSGYSGLVHIMQLLPEVIKLDRQLTTGVHQDPVRQALATALVTFAGRIGAAVVAEGIEVEGEAQVLSALGVGYGQGYLFGRPGPVQALSTQTNG